MSDETKVTQEYGGEHRRCFKIKLKCRVSTTHQYITLPFLNKNYVYQLCLYES